MAMEPYPPVLLPEGEGDGNLRVGNDRSYSGLGCGVETLTPEGVAT
jgi:hypothetical protein